MLLVRRVRSHKPSAKDPPSQLAYPAPASLSETVSPSLPTQLGHNSVSIGPGERPGTNTAPSVQISTSADCVTPEIMTQLLARDTSDPMKVSTPSRIDGLERVLKEFGTFEEWSHKIGGLGHGFDVRAEARGEGTITKPNRGSCSRNEQFISDCIAPETLLRRVHAAGVGVRISPFAHLHSVCPICSISSSTIRANQS